LEGKSRGNLNSKATMKLSLAPGLPPNWWSHHSG